MGLDDVGDLVPPSARPQVIPTVELSILLVIGSAERGGAELQLCRLAKELSYNGVQVSILFMGGIGPLVEDLRRTGIQVEMANFGGFSPSRFRIIPTRDSIRGLFSLARTLIKLRFQKFDVVHLWLGQSIQLLLGFFPFLLPRGCKTIASFRGEVPSSTLIPPRRFFRKALERADSILVNSPSLLEHAIGWGSPRKSITFIPNGVDLPPFERPLTDSEKKTKAIVVANNRPYKGYLTLLDALALCESRPEVTICGDRTDELSAEITARGLQQEIHILGSRADVISLISTADFMIHPSEQEGMSNAILEGIAAGLPVIACDVGANRLLVKHGVNGFIVVPRSPREIAEKIDLLAGNPDLRREMGGQSARIATSFSWPACVDAYLSHYAALKGGTW